MKKNIQIIYIKGTNEIFNRQSALGSYIHCLATILVDGGYNVRLNDIDFNTVSRKASVSYFRGGSSIVKKIIPDFIKKIIKDLLLFQNIRKIKDRIKKKFNSDVILEFYCYGSNVGEYLSKLKKIPLIIIYDSPIIEEYIFFNNIKPYFFNLIRTRELKTLLKASPNIVYSEPVRKYVENIAKTKLNISIHQNVDFSRFEFIEEKEINDKLNIGFLGSFLKWHRVDLLIDVFIKLRSKCKNIHLILLGDGEEFSNLRVKVHNCEYSKDITMPGYVDKEDLLNYKMKIDIGVSPSSNWYNAPNKIFEYGAAKMAVVAPSTPTIADLFENEKDLILFDNESFDGLYNSLLRLIENKELLKSLAENLQNKIKSKYSKENTFEFYNNLIINS